MATCVAHCDKFYQNMFTIKL